MERYYLAVDIGASSGRHILGSVKDGRMELEEVYRFPNGMKQKDGQLCWDVEELFYHIRQGMKRCAELGKIPCSMGIDTWAVDFVLMDVNDQVVGNTVGYRDGRTRGMDEEVYKIIPEEKLYGRTGIQKQIFNTIYQFMAVKKQHPEYLEQARTMLMIPDYFHYLLTGVKKQEYTNATTTQLVNPETKEWDMDLIGMLGYPAEWFGPLSMPGTLVGSLKDEIAKEVGFQCQVVLPATHDTGSAVMAVPSNEDDVLYISSGTWSLMGTERMKADCSMESMKRNFTNEGGYEYRFRYLKNIMGLWMVQCLKREWPEKYSFGEICAKAEQAGIPSVVNCEDERFLAPESIIREVQEACRESGQEVPQTLAELARVIYRSLALCYRDTAREIEALTGNIYRTLHIVGGGANAEFLNQLTADVSGRTVFAGPTEATAIGNLMVQMLQKKEWENLAQARQCVFDSFEIRRYDPRSK